MQINTQNTNDRHRAGSVQMKIWLSGDLKNEFTSLCTVQGICASAVLRGLLAAYIQRATGVQHGNATDR
jgi:hypothetical protein